MTQPINSHFAEVACLLWSDSVALFVFDSICHVLVHLVILNITACCLCPLLVIVCIRHSSPVGLWLLLAPPTQISAFWLVCLSVCQCHRKKIWHRHISPQYPQYVVLINEVQWFYLNMHKLKSYFLRFWGDVTHWLLCGWQLCMWKWTLIDRCRSKL